MSIAAEKKNILNKIVSRAHYLANQMIVMANQRKDKEKGDPKVGGHSSGTASAIHIMGALHLVVRTGFDHFTNKPHASPADHAYSYLLKLLLHDDYSQFSEEDANIAMQGLRAFSKQGEPVFQSYHSAHDPDNHNVFPSGTVGIPPVKAGFLAHAYQYAKNHGYKVPEAHFWCVIGDAEFREGSLHEAIPEFSEREVGQLTWIVDYNRQSLDGHRISNMAALQGNDDDRIAHLMEANGWEVISVRHGELRKKLFKKEGGLEFQKWLEEDLNDYELQAMLLLKDSQKLHDHLSTEHTILKVFLNNVKPDELFDAMRDLGGHDIVALVEAMEKSKESNTKPTMIIAHTLKGWGLEMEAAAGNHSSIPSNEEMARLRASQGLNPDVEFKSFAESTAEGEYLLARGKKLLNDIKVQNDLKIENKQFFQNEYLKFGELPDNMDINLKMASYPHTQWMLGQITSKLTRISNTPLDENLLQEKQKALKESEKCWILPGQIIVPMAPDVGTSTNLNPSMDGKIFGAEVTEDFETELNVKNLKTPDLVPGDTVGDRFLRFEIVESNVMSCMGAYGKMEAILGIPLLPLMTVYDFFVKRALDQYFYNLYWKSSFILVGTPSGVTLSPEGAQHGWKSDIQIPNQICWEPFYCIEMEWILCDAIKRHFTNDNIERNGVHVRGVTRGIDQKTLLKNLKTQKRFKVGLEENQSLHSPLQIVPGAVDESQLVTVSDDEILKQMRINVLDGAYYLLNYSGYGGYEPGDNVVNIFAMGSIGTEALKASEILLKIGIYANVIMVTSPDLLVGNLGQKNNFDTLINKLNINANLYLQPMLNGNSQTQDLVTMAGRRVPIVSAHDGEPGLLDNLGSIVGVKHEALAVRKHSKCGRPDDVYKYHGIDSNSIAQTCGKILSETALEQVEISRRIIDESVNHPKIQVDWRQLWKSPTEPN